MGVTGFSPEVGHFAYVQIKLLAAEDSFAQEVQCLYFGNENSGELHGEHIESFAVTVQEYGELFESILRELCCNWSGRSLTA